MKATGDSPGRYCSTRVNRTSYSCCFPSERLHERRGNQVETRGLKCGNQSPPDPSCETPTHSPDPRRAFFAYKKLICPSIATYVRVLITFVCVCLCFSVSLCARLGVCVCVMSVYLYLWRSSTLYFCKSAPSVISVILQFMQLLWLWDFCSFHVFCKICHSVIFFIM